MTYFPHAASEIVSDFRPGKLSWFGTSCDVKSFAGKHGELTDCCSWASKLLINMYDNLQTNPNIYQ